MPQCKKCRKCFIKNVNLKIHILKHEIRSLKRELIKIQRMLPPVESDLSDDSTESDTDVEEEHGMSYSQLD
jgi:hypothetical protein